MDCRECIRAINKWLKKSWEQEAIQQNGYNSAAPKIPADVAAHTETCRVCSAHLEGAKQMAGTNEYIEGRYYQAQYPKVVSNITAKVMQRISEGASLQQDHSASNNITAMPPRGPAGETGEARKPGDKYGPLKTWRQRIAVAAAAVLLIVSSSLITTYVLRSTQNNYVTVHLQLEIPDAKEVAVVGDWNGWNSDKHQLVNINKSGIWEIKIKVEPGKEYRYQFVIDGEQWIPDPDSSLRVEDGFGGINSVLEI